MSEEKYFYKSPLGILFLKTADNFLQEASFLDEDKTDDNNSTDSHSALLSKIINGLDKYFSGEDLNLDFPIEQTGTDFQQRVWKQLLKIKP